VTIDPRVETVSGGQALVEVHSVGPRRFTVRGHIPIGHKPVVKVYEVEEPAAFARTLFIETLRNRGVSIGASPLASNEEANLPSKGEVAALPVVAEYTSPPLREYLKVILKVSQNLHASTLPLLIAANHGESTLDRGLKREGEILGKLGVDVKTISFGGGAGGSRSDLVTPRATVALLRAMAARPDFASYDAALPVLGRDGTLAKAVSPESSARGHVRAKTGTYWVDNALSGQPVMISKALAGYLETASGRKLTFAFFVNNVPLEAIGGSVPEASITAGRRLARLCEVFYAEPLESAEPPAPPAEPAKTGR
jgi:D-alanyl-D-alanine carboxypeptidase/D-alanyl-D-alanine-endopeptidase (penicillin-binding protein 4)